MKGTKAKDKDICSRKLWEKQYKWRGKNGETYTTYISIYPTRDEDLEDVYCIETMLFDSNDERINNQTLLVRRITLENIRDMIISELG